MRALLRTVLLSLCFGALCVAAKEAPQEELRELRERLESLQKELSESQQSKNAAQDALKSSELAISNANRKLRTTSSRLKSTQAELDSLRKRLGETQSAVKEAQSRLEQVLRARYQDNANTAAPIVLSGKDPAEIQRQLEYYGYIAKAQAGAIEDLRGRMSELDRLTQSTKEKETELAALESEQREHHQTLESERQQRRAALATIAEDIKRQRQEIASLKRNEARLTRIVEELARMLAKREAQRKEAARLAALERAKRRAQEAKLAAKPGRLPGKRAEEPPEPPETASVFSRLRGKLRFPVQGELRSRFGSPLNGAGISGNGILIGAIDGADVEAVANGRVVFADWLRGFGNLIILDHGGGYMSVYGNNESLLKQVGEDVTTGTTIASVGASGGNAQTGLYFELRFKGKPMDPMAWLAK